MASANGQGDGEHTRTLLTWELPLDAHPSIDFFSDYASIAVVPVEGEAPRMFARTLGADSPRVDIRAENGRTTVRVGLEGQRFFFWRDPGRLQLVACVPPSLSGCIRTTSGRIEVGRLRGCDLELETKAGAIRAEDVEGSLRLRSKAGRIQALGVSGSIDVNATSGSIQLYLNALEPGQHRVRAYVGAIDVFLKAGLAARVRAAAHVGRAVVDVPARADAPAELEVVSHLGAVRVIEASSSKDPSLANSSETAITSETPDEIDRIVSLVVAGRITAKEAEELLSAL